MGHVRRLLFLLPFLLFGHARAQLPVTFTHVALAQLLDGGNPMPSGTVCLTPADSYGNPITVSVSGYGLVKKGAQFCQNVVAGAFPSSLTVPSACATNNPVPITYNIVIQELDGTGDPSGVPVVIPAVPNICGVTYTLDTYAPVATSAAPLSPPLAQGIGVPSACTAPSIWLRTDTSSLYACEGGQFVAVSSQGGGAGTFSSLTVNGGYAAYDDYVQGPTPPAQAPNSFRLQAPTNIPVSFLGVWPSSPPTSTSCLQMPAGGGQMFWGLCSGSGGSGSLGTANTWTAMQTFSAGLAAGSSAGWHVVDLGNGYTSMTFNTSDADTTRVGFVGSPGDPNLYADFQGKLNFRHASTNTSSFLDGNGFNGGVGQTAPSAGSFTNVYASGSLIVGGPFTNGNLHFVSVGGGYYSLSINGNDTDGGRMGFVGSSNDANLNLDWPAGAQLRFRTGSTSPNAGYLDANGFHGLWSTTATPTASTTASNYSIPVGTSSGTMYLRLSTTP